MTKTMCGAAALMLLSAPVMAHDVTRNAPASLTTNTITVVCYRGPWEQVLWDRAKPEFLDSLTRAGFTPERARAIGNRLCRDQSLVNNPERLREEATRVIRETPRE